MDDPIARHVRCDLLTIGMLRDQERGELSSVLRADLLPMEVALDDGAVVSEEGTRFGNRRSPTMIGILLDKDILLKKDNYNII